MAGPRNDGPLAQAMDGITTPTRRISTDCSRKAGHETWAVTSSCNSSAGTSKTRLSCAGTKRRPSLPRIKRPMPADYSRSLRKSPATSSPARCKMLWVRPPRNAYETMPTGGLGSIIPNAYRQAKERPGGVLTASPRRRTRWLCRVWRSPVSITFPSRPDCRSRSRKCSFSKARSTRRCGSKAGLRRPHSTRSGCVRCRPS